MTRKWNEATECPWCGSPGPVCENPSCSGPSVCQEKVVVDLPPSKAQKQVAAQDEREKLLARNRDLACRRDEIQSLIKTWKFRKGSKELATLKANDKRLISEMTVINQDLATLNAMRKIMSEGRNHG